MRGCACQLRCRKCRRGKQHETKFCHDDPSPPGRFSAAKSHSQSQTVMSRSTACMGPHCGARKKGNVFYFARTRGWARNLFIAHSEATLVRETLRSEPALTGSEPAQCISAQCFCLTHFLQANWHPGQALVRKRSNPLPDLAWSGLAIPVSGFRQAFVRAVHRAAVAGQARAPAAALPDVDCRADPLAAARSAGPVSAAESLEVRSAFTS
jgi:hypothetical protein